MIGSHIRGAASDKGGSDQAEGTSTDDIALNPLSEVKLWNNPLRFSHRLNTAASFFNVPIYGWIESEFGLTRPQFVVLFSVYLRNESTAHDICVSSVFPKNTISRAVLHVIRGELLESAPDPDDNRRLLLRITRKGKAIIENVLPVLRRQEDVMLSSLTPRERRTLEDLLERIILNQGGQAPSEVAEEARMTQDKAPEATKGARRKRAATK